MAGAVPSALTGRSSAAASNYPSDVFAGGALGIAVALAAWLLSPLNRLGDGEGAPSVKP